MISFELVKKWKVLGFKIVVRYVDRRKRRQQATPPRLVLLEHKTPKYQEHKTSNSTSETPLEHASVYRVKNSRYAKRKRATDK